MALVASIDTYYAWVKKQMQLVNPARVARFKGVALAQDWPQLEVQDGDIWLLYLNSVKVGGTKAVPLYKHFLQWAWLLIGNDIQADQVAANRAKFRDHAALQEELKQCNYPGFAWKVLLTVDQLSGAATLTQVDPVEMVRWTDLTMPTKFNQTAGVVYGYAAVEVDAYDATLPAVDRSVAYPPVPTT